MGRKKGSRNRRTKSMTALAYRAAMQGITPLEIMLNSARYFYSQAMNAKRQVKGKGKRTRTEKYVNEELLEKASDIAADAAPYVHPRLSAVELIKTTSDEDLDRIIAAASVEAGVTINMRGVNQQLVIEAPQAQQQQQPAVPAITVPALPDPPDTPDTPA